MGQTPAWTPTSNGEHMQNCKPSSTAKAAASMGLKESTRVMTWRSQPSGTLPPHAAGSLFGKTPGPRMTSAAFYSLTRTPSARPITIPATIPASFPTQPGLVCATPSPCTQPGNTPARVEPQGLWNAVACELRQHAPPGSFIRVAGLKHCVASFAMGNAIHLPPQKTVPALFPDWGDGDRDEREWVCRMPAAVHGADTPNRRTQHCTLWAVSAEAWAVDDPVARCFSTRAAHDSDPSTLIQACTDPCAGISELVSRAFETTVLITVQDGSKVHDRVFPTGSQAPAPDATAIRIRACLEPDGKCTFTPASQPAPRAVQSCLTRDVVDVESFDAAPMPSPARIETKRKLNMDA